MAMVDAFECLFFNLRSYFYPQVALVCAVESFPPAQITWIHNGIQVRVDFYFIFNNP
jgi:hypothetical protein